MPPKNTPKLDPDDVHFHSPEGLQPIWIDEVPDIEEAPEGLKKHSYIKSAADATLTFDLLVDSLFSVTATLGCLAQAYNAFVEALAAAVMMRTSPRVRHLAKYGKKYRTRKKNINRAVREYRKEAKQ